MPNGAGGSGGGGGPVGFANSFTGTAEALEIIGKHCFAYSGVKNISGATTADTEFLKFTTGNYYSKVFVDWAYNERHNETYYRKVDMNGVSIYLEQHDSDGLPRTGPDIRFIIPPYTEFTVFYGTESSSGVNCTVTLTGRIYR